MFTTSLATKREKVLRMLSENLHTEHNISLERRLVNDKNQAQDNNGQPLDLSKPKYYTADDLKIKWMKLCEGPQKKVTVEREFEDEKPNKRRRIEFPGVSDEAPSTSVFHNSPNQTLMEGL